MSGDRKDATTAGGKMLRLLVCGAPEDGASALIGRLLHAGNGDGNDRREERRSSIFGDVACRSVSTARRTFAIAAGSDDALALAAAASCADLAVLLVDARGGPPALTRRQLLICSLFGVRHIVLAVDRLDRVGFERDVFERIADDYVGFAGDLGFASITAIPISAQDGDNVTARSERTPWYAGPGLLEHLEAIELGAPPAERPPDVPAELADQFAAHLVWLRDAAIGSANAQYH